MPGLMNGMDITALKQEKNVEPIDETESHIKETHIPSNEHNMGPLSYIKQDTDTIVSVKKKDEYIDEKTAENLESSTMSQEAAANTKFGTIRKMMKKYTNKSEWTKTLPITRKENKDVSTLVKIKTSLRRKISFTTPKTKNFNQDSCSQSTLKRKNKTKNQSQEPTGDIETSCSVPITETTEESNGLTLYTCVYSEETTSLFSEDTMSRANLACLAIVTQLLHGSRGFVNCIVNGRAAQVPETKTGTMNLFGEGNCLFLLNEIFDNFKDASIEKHKPKNYENTGEQLRDLFLALSIEVNLLSSEIHTSRPKFSTMRAFIRTKPSIKCQFSKMREVLDKTLQITKEDLGLNKSTPFLHCILDICSKCLGVVLNLSSYENRSERRMAICGSSDRIITPGLMSLHLKFNSPPCCCLPAIPEEIKYRKVSIKQLAPIFVLSLTHYTTLPLSFSHAGKMYALSSFVTFTKINANVFNSKTFPESKKVYADKSQIQMFEDFQKHNPIRFCIYETIN